MINVIKIGTSYFNDRRGSIAPLFGLMVVPMLAITGGAIDIGQAITAENKLQNALDAASVAACSATLGQKTTEEILRAYLTAELADSQMGLKPPPQDGIASSHIEANEVELSNTQFDPATGTLSPKVKSQVGTTLLKLIGINSIDIEATSSVKCGAKRLELSLVLDITGSMGSTVRGKKKIDSMKEASLDVLDIFDRNLQAGATRIALVPFSETVNVGSMADSVRGTIKSGTSSSVGSNKLRFKDRRNKTKKWKASKCVSERIGPHAFDNAVPNCSGSSCTAPVGHVYTSRGNCNPGNEIQPLTADKNALKAQIQSYQPSGYTAGHIGAAWGWYLLSDRWGSLFPSGSEPEASDPDELIKATIIMTDGEFNTQYSNGVQDRSTRSSANNGSSNSQFEKICEAMKDPNGDGVYDEADSVVVYTIGFGLNEYSSTANRLKKCATDNTKYFFPYDGDELRAAFKSIGKQLSGGQAGLAIVKN